MTEMRKHQVKEVFTYRNRLCVIIEMGWQANYARTIWDNGSVKMLDYCNGYAQVTKKNIGKNYNEFIDKIKADELTFSGYLDVRLDDKRIPKDMWFFGFDSAHGWNDEEPESKTCVSVKTRLMKMVDEMVRRRI